MTNFIILIGNFIDENLINEFSSKQKFNVKLDFAREQTIEKKQIENFIFIIQNYKLQGFNSYGYKSKFESNSESGPSYGYRPFAPSHNKLYHVNYKFFLRIIKKSK